MLHFERVLHLSGSGRLKDKKNETLTPAVAEPAGFILTRFNMGTSLIGTSLNICVLIATSTCDLKPTTIQVSSYLLLYMLLYVSVSYDSVAGATTIYAEPQ